MSSQPTSPSNAPRYLFLFLLGLVIGIIGLVMVLRAIEGRKTWQDHFPEAAMHVMDAHVQELRATATANRCNATDVLPHLQTLRYLANDPELAFPDLRDDVRFTKHAGELRSTLDGLLATPPLGCPGVEAAIKQIGVACKACHQDFRG
jgi:cytochrome c556